LIKKILSTERDNLCLQVRGAEKAKAGHNQEGLKVVQITSKLPLLLTLVSFLDIMVQSNETSFNTSNHENIIWYLGRTTLMS
jgi:hypothetical protein